jgi:hypothetical protein
MAKRRLFGSGLNSSLGYIHVRIGARELVVIKSIEGIIIH